MKVNKVVVVEYRYDHNYNEVYYEEKEMKVPILQFEEYYWNDVVGEKYNNKMINSFIKESEMIINKMPSLERIIEKTNSFSPVELQYKSIEEDILKMRVK